MSCGSRLRGKRKSTLIKRKLHFYNHALLYGQLPMLDRQIAEGRIAWFGILNDFLQVSALALKILQ
jgi:gluconate kinase